jgi:hypothetical protein
MVKSYAKVIFAQVTNQNFYTPTQIENVQITNQPHQQNSDIHELKNYERSS